MRTVLYKICLFNDKLEMHDRVFISKQCKRGESKTAKRQKERECERQRVARNESVGNIIDCWRKYLWQMWE